MPSVITSFSFRSLTLQSTRRKRRFNQSRSACMRGPSGHGVHFSFFKSRGTGTLDSRLWALLRSPLDTVALMRLGAKDQRGMWVAGRTYHKRHTTYVQIVTINVTSSEASGCIVSCSRSPQLPLQGDGSLRTRQKGRSPCPLTTPS